MADNKFMIMVNFSGGSRLLRKSFIEDKIQPDEHYIKEVEKIFPTAVVHDIQFYDTQFLHEKVFKRHTEDRYKVTIEDI